MLKSHAHHQPLCPPQRLGEMLHSAHLISLPQIKLVLRDQQHYQDLRFGEILALRGWLKQATCDFFADEWQNILCHSSKHMLGFYLQRAALLENEQISAILEEQQRTGFKFGAVAVLNGWMKQETLDFFLQSLFPQHHKAAPFVHHLEHHASLPQGAGFPNASDLPHASPSSFPPAQTETVTIAKGDISWCG